jgi:hypothetical protein
MPSKIKQPKDHFAWRNQEWWDWFCGHRRRPTVNALVRYLHRFRGFVVFHGCRPTEIELYHGNGLRPSDLQQLNEVARRLFLKGQFPEIDETGFEWAVELASKSASSANDEGKIFLAIDDENLIQHCGHYLIYGSEYICGIAAKLCRKYGGDYRQILKRFGIPTVFGVSLPIDDVGDQGVQSLARHLSRIIWESRAQPTPPMFDWTFTIKRALHPDEMLGHYHPVQIPDPLLGYTPYRYSEKSPAA